MLCVSLVTRIFGAAERPIDVIEDNSFLIEEAYNQDAGTVQHIFTAVYNNDSRRRCVDSCWTEPQIRQSRGYCFIFRSSTIYFESKSVELFRELI
jgi:hypothetical protein